MVASPSQPSTASSNRIATNDEVVRLGRDVLRTLADNRSISAHQWQAIAAVDEDLDDYLTMDKPALDEAEPQDVLVELLVERMMIRVADSGHNWNTLERLVDGDRGRAHPGRVALLSEAEFTASMDAMHL